jgi:hypothetical protein
MISEQDIQKFEQQLARFQHTEFSCGTRNFLRQDVPDFIAKVRQLRSELDAHKEHLRFALQRAHAEKF